MALEAPPADDDGAVAAVIESLGILRQLHVGRNRRPIADTPAVKAVHIENPDARPGQWEGLNVYELKGETRVFVLMRKK